mgnify:CR=1 FL=1
MNGQRVIKVFNHEQISKEEFDELNESLFVSASRAHTFASMMGPIIGNIGNLQFVLTAILGGVSLDYGNRKYYLGCHGFLSAVYKEFYPAFYAGGSAV